MVAWYVVDSKAITTNLIFFFSSRRRHTRSDRDWSSDVCSSDLCPLHFTQQYNAITIPASLLAEPLPRAYPKYNERLDRKSVV